MSGENLGSVYYTVDADTTAMLQAEAQINKSLEGVVKDFRVADKAVTDFMKTQASLGRTINSSGQVFSKSGKAIVSASNDYRALAAAANSAKSAAVGMNNGFTKTAAGVQKGMNGMKGAAQNFSYQIQDIAVQLAGGQNPFLILSQQLPQMLVGMGAAAAGIGAFIAIAGGIAMVMNRDADAVKGLDQALEALEVMLDKTASGMNVLSTEAYELAKISNEAAKLQLASAILKARVELDKVSGSAEDAFRGLQKFLSPDDISVATNAIKLLKTEFANTGESALETFNRLKGAPIQLSGEISQLDSNLQSIMKSLGVTRDQAFGFVESLANFKETKAPEELIKIANQVAELGLSQKKLAPKMQDFIEKFSELGIKALKTSDGLAKATKLINDFDASVSSSDPKVSKYADTITSMIESLKLETETLGTSDRAKALHVAWINKATQAQYDEINSAYDAIEAQKAKEEANIKSAKSEASLVSALKVIETALSDQMAQLTMTADGYEAYALRKKLASEGASEAVIKANLAELKSLQDLRKETEIMAQVDSENQTQKLKVQTDYEQVGQAITSDIETPAQKAERELSERLEVIRLYNGLETAEEAAKTETGIAAHQAYSNKIASIDQELADKKKQANMATLSAAGDFFGNMADIAKEGGKKSFDTWKVMASAQAGISAALAIINTMASVPFPYNVAASVGVGALAAVQVAKISSMSYSGGKLYGGSVQAGNMYPVNENGAPELFQSGNKQYLMPNAQGKVISNKDATANKGGETMVNFTYSPSIQALDSDGVAAILSEQQEVLWSLVQRAANERGRSV